MNNPFTLSFGKKPLNYIYRIKDTDLVIESFTQEPSTNQLYVITGIRGSGKTVLITALTKAFYEMEDWIIVDLNPDKDLIEGLASELYENSKIKKLFVKKEFSFSFKGVSFSIEGDVPALTSETLVKKMLEKIKEKKKKVLITIDEVTSNEYMRVFAKTFQSLVRFDFPVYLLMTGLYENISKLQDDKSLTFLYRAPKINLSPLNLSSIAMSYKKIFAVNEEEAMELAKMTNGYAYAYQVLGYLLFKDGKKEADEDILSQYDQYLQEYVYKKIWSELSDVEQKIMMSIKTNNPVSIKSLIKTLEINNSYFSIYRDRLIKKGIIYAPAYGKIQFVLPRFYEFIKSMMYY